MNSNRLSKLSGLALALAIGAGASVTAVLPVQAQVADTPRMDLRNWNYNDLYRGAWSAERLLDEAEVVGTLGDDIGSVENIIVSENGRILGIIAQVGGFWDIGDTHVFVPWDQVRVSPSLQRVMVPLTEENVDDYVGTTPSYLTRAATDQTRPVDDDLDTGPRVWKVTDLIDDYAYLNRRTGYGYVQDVLFSGDGMVTGVVVNATPAYGSGLRAFPYYGYATGRPGIGHYNLGYGESEVRVLEPFQYNRLPSRVNIRTQAETADLGAMRNRDAGVTGAVPVQWTFRDFDRDGNLELTDREFARLGRDIYGRWDVDANDRLTENEFYTGMYRVFDADRDQRLTEREFNTAWRTWGRGSQPLAYETLDRDQSGFVDANEFRQGFNRIGYFDRWGAGGRGYLTENQFNTRLYETWTPDGDRGLTEDQFAQFTDRNWF